MGETPFYKKKWFYVITRLAATLVTYFVITTYIDRFDDNLNNFAKDFLVFISITVLWFAFFAQFILPVRTFRDRQKIFNRLILHLFGFHGPAVFIQNGEIKEHSGEHLKKGPGVLWLDSASAAVTRTAVKIKQTIGPGVHFTENKEFIEGTVDLHIQLHKIGPKELDKPFDEKKEDQSQEEYQQIQDRRHQTSALTRDGIEVVPNISVIFRVDTGFPKEGEVGSRFGYRTGHTKKDKENEDEDKEAIRRAILGEGVNSNALSDSPRRRTAWNQIPAMVAADLWREYVGKFTLNELFQPDQPVSTPPAQLPEPTEEEIESLNQPLQVTPSRITLLHGLAAMLHELNLLMAWGIKKLEWKERDKTDKHPQSQPPLLDAKKSDENQKKTALQVINDMVKARLIQAEVDLLDEYGHRGIGTVTSPEFELLMDRGLKVLNVSISNVRFSESIENQIIEQWKASWLNNAKAEEDRINRLIELKEIKGSEDAELKYTIALARHIMKQKPVNQKETLRALLMRTRLVMIRDNHLRSRMGTEREDIEYILEWLENGP